MSLIFPVSPLFARGGAKALNIADAFSTDLYTGNGSTQTITNGIDLAGKGGLVWLKARGIISSIAPGHLLYDTARGTNSYLQTDTTGGDGALSTSVTGFNNDGFSLGSFQYSNNSGSFFVAWTFRRAPKFFDVVTYTGDGVSGRTIAHNLGVAPGMIVVKRRNGASNWKVYHITQSFAADLDSTQPFNQSFSSIGFVSFNESAFVVSGPGGDVNVSGETYVAYLFAHDTDPKGVIQCGSYTAGGFGAGPTINLGWEPQWILARNVSESGHWYVFDSARGMGAGKELYLRADLSAQEFDDDFFTISSTGFKIDDGNNALNVTIGSTIIYMAIRAEGT